MVTAQEDKPSPEQNEERSAPSPARRVIVTGGSGFIGRPLCSLLAGEGYEVVILSRNPSGLRRELPRGVTALGWDSRSARGWGEVADGALAIVNLTGANIGEGRWTSAKKDSILQSRLDAGRAVTRAVEQAETRPGVVIQGSAVGYYGNTTAPVDEHAPPGEGFLADVAVKWEMSTEGVERLGVRRAVIRTAMVLGPGGALEKMVTPFKFFAGGPLGDGKQGVSWIHRRDEVRAIKFLIENESTKGPYNLSSPNPVDFREFCKALGRALHRPCGLSMPEWAVRLVFGEMGRELLLQGQFAEPKRLLEAGFSFQYKDIQSALENILSSGKSEEGAGA